MYYLIMNCFLYIRFEAVPATNLALETSWAELALGNRSPITLLAVNLMNCNTALVPIDGSRTAQVQDDEKFPE